MSAPRTATTFSCWVRPALLTAGVFEIRAETGEEIVGAWLRYIANCEFVEYGVQIPGAGEIDVVGLSLKANRAYVCEVASHIHRLHYKDNEATIVGKFERAKQYADGTLQRLGITYEFWSPIVRSGAQMGGMTNVLATLRDEPCSIRW